MTSGVYPRKKPPVSPCECGKKALANGKCTACYTRSRRARRSAEQVALDRKRAAAAKRVWYAHMSPAEKRSHIRYNVLRRYHLTRAAFNDLMAAQGGVCALCHRPPADGEVFRVDHDHGCCSERPFCGKCVRGLLHHGCNVRLAFMEDVEFRERATRYLEDWKRRRFGAAA